MTSRALKTFISRRWAVGQAASASARPQNLFFPQQNSEPPFEKMKLMRSPLLGLLAAVFLQFAQTAGAFPVITTIVETNAALDANDTVPAKWTGTTWSDHANGEPILGLAT